MPIVNYEQVRSLFRENAYDRSETHPPTSANPNRTTVASDQQGQEAANTSPKPSAIDLDSLAGGLRSPIYAQQQGRKPYGGFAGTKLGEVRTGFVLTSNLWIQEGKALALHAGPSQAQWNIALRAADEQNKAGHARYVQARYSHHGSNSNATPTYFDFPKVSFSFQAGNIMPIPGYQKEVGMADGLRDFYNFFALMNQPPILPSGPREGQHNYTWIFYTSLQFPQVTLKGYFEPDGISWTDSADTPTTLEWESSFLVHEMTPNLWEVTELENAYRDYMQDSVRLF